MLRSKWKKWLLRAVGCLAALALIIVTGGAVLFRNELKTLDSLKKIDDNVLYTMKYEGDYGFDDFLKVGASTDGELVKFVTERLLYLTQHGKEGDGYYRLAIPNREIRNIIIERILKLFRGEVSQNREMFRNFYTALQNANAPVVKNSTRKAFSSRLAGKISTTSPRTRNFPR